MDREIIHIHKPWWGAWKKFGWEKGIPGIGVNHKLVNDAFGNQEKLYFQIGDNPTVYEIPGTTILRYYIKNKTKYKARKGVLLYVFPRNLLRKVIEDDKEDNSKKSQSSVVEQDLFK